MTADSIVTIWHFEENSEEAKRRVFNGVYVDSVNRISKNGIKQKGFYDGNSAVVRIPTSDEIGVIPGDYIFCGETEDDFLDIDNCLKITEVKDNRRGAQKHWRILCGG